MRLLRLTELTLERTPARKSKIKLHKRAASDSPFKALAQVLMRASAGRAVRVAWR